MSALREPIPRAQLTWGEVALMMRAAYGDRLVSKIDASGDCWLWTAGKDRCGYGRFGVKGRNRLAHRVVYELAVGQIPQGLTLDHRCKTRHCVNPGHLDPISLRENILRGDGVGVVNAARTHCAHGHEFTPENTYVARGKRHCRECGRRTTAAWHAKKRQESA